jgi:steroid delta-isomerase-like uncharacterized protein
MSTDITSIARRFGEEAINQRRLDLLDDIMAPDYTNHGAPPGTPKGPAGERAFAEIFLAAFPDLHIAIEDAFGCGDRVAARCRYTGTHTGDYMGIPATGKSFAIGTMNIFRVRDGKITDNWNQNDMLGLLQQLGVIPAQG